MGVAGAWTSWTRSEISAVAALSPWHRPFLVQDRIGHMTNDHTLYHGGTLDKPITPELTKSGGTYSQTGASKYIQVFSRAGHSAWTDGRRASRFHSDMVYYYAAFFDAFLKNGSTTKLEVKKSRLKALEYDH